MKIMTNIPWLVYVADSNFNKSAQMDEVNGKKIPSKMSKRNSSLTGILDLNWVENCVQIDCQGGCFCHKNTENLILWFYPQCISGLCDTTITELNIDLDVEILQNLLILSCYWYCEILNLVIDIDIGIAK